MLCRPVRLPAAASNGFTTCFAPDPDLGASELETLDREWSDTARPEDRYALAAALQELVDTGLVWSRARARSLLTIASARDYRGETTQLAESAAEALRLALASEDRSAEADARCLEGDVFRVLGKLLAARRHSRNSERSISC